MLCKSLVSLRLILLHLIINYSLLCNNWFRSYISLKHIEGGKNAQH